MYPVVISQFLSLFVCYSGCRMLEARKTFVSILEYQYYWYSKMDKMKTKKDQVVV